MESIIYKITCVPTGKFYIGSTDNKRERWYNHKWRLNKGTHHSIYLQRAWNKYGEDSFVFEVLEEVEIDALIEREQYYLDTLRPFSFEGRGFNSAPIAGSTRGHKRTPEQIEKTAKHHRGKRFSEERKRQIGERRKGKRHTEETKEKIRQSKLGDKNPQWGKPMNQNQQNALLNRCGEKNHNFGKKFSPEVCEKMSNLRSITPIKQIDENGNIVNIWSSISNAARGVGLVGTSSIHNALKDRNRRAAGFYWERI